MGVPVLILGESGSGKSASLRNFTKDEVGVMNVASKPLPFKSDIKPYNVNRAAKQKNRSRYDLIKSAIKQSKTKTLVIDDSQYLLAFDSFDKAKETGYGKFTTMAVNFEKLIEFCIDDVDDDKIIYFLHHCETNELGKVKAKTIVLFCQTDGKTHEFVTQSDGFTTAKSPMGMFEPKIDNDLKAVDKIIREYYNLNTEKENEN